MFQTTSQIWSCQADESNNNTKYFYRTSSSSSGYPFAWHIPKQPKVSIFVRHQIAHPLWPRLYSFYLHFGAYHSCGTKGKIRKYIYEHMGIWKRPMVCECKWFELLSSNAAIIVWNQGFVRQIKSRVRIISQTIHVWFHTEPACKMQNSFPKQICDNQPKKDTWHVQNWNESALSVTILILIFVPILIIEELKHPINLVFHSVLNSIASHSTIR